MSVPPSHNSEHINFEDELDNYGNSCLMVTTDNPANLKNAFLIVNDNDNDVDVENDDNEDEEDEVNIVKQWTSHLLKF